MAVRDAVVAADTVAFRAAPDAGVVWIGVRAGVLRRSRESAAAILGEAAPAALEPL